MPKRIEMVGLKFDRLTVKKQAGDDGHGHISWLCKCDCGMEVVKTGNYLRCKHNTAKSCGCLHKERASEANLKHGMSKTLTYATWVKMKGRCLNNKDKNYQYYGGRGIAVCKRWLKFENFFVDMGEKPKGLTIERIQNNLGYFKENCKWATWAEQNRNTRHNRMISFQGKTLCACDWAKELNVVYQTLLARLNKYPPEIAFSM